MSLREGLHALAEQAPAPTVPPGLFDRARRRHRQRWAAATIAVVAVFTLAGYGVTRPDVANEQQFAGGPAGIPRTVSDPPAWTQELTKSPIGAASVVFRGPAVPDRHPFRESIAPTALVGLTADTYRVVYPFEATLALSPDGRTLLMPHFDEEGADLRARHFRTDALDLASGATQALAAGYVPLGWSVDGKRALLVRRHFWDDQGEPTERDLTVSVVSWASGQQEWSVHIPRRDPADDLLAAPVALSPDGSMLAVSTSHELRVYHRDGTLRWKTSLTGMEVVAGPAAWRDDGRLAVLRRSARPGSSEPDLWTLGYVDAASGRPLPDPGLPTVQSTIDVRVTAWRGDTAYAVVQAASDGASRRMQASLVRLAPGASSPETILAPAGVSALNVATDYVDQTRTATAPSYGLSVTGVLALLWGFGQYVVIGTVIAALVWVIWRRRRRSRRSV
ncbi:MAG TPA: hypothetical protein VK453_25940 [Micromonosporaceae bacterium]|nr:hypothetical protein [Micromonosporaceae bacterium]